MQLFNCEILIRRFYQNPHLCYCVGVTLDDHLSFTANIACNNIRRICPVLTLKATQVLVQDRVISTFDYCKCL